MIVNNKANVGLRKAGLEHDLCFLADDIMGFVDDSKFYAREPYREDVVEEFSVDKPELVRYVLNTLVQYEYLKVVEEGKYCFA